MADEGYLAPRLYTDNDSDMGYYASALEDTEGDLGYYIVMGSVKSNPTSVITIPDTPVIEIPVYKYTLSSTGVVYTSVTLANSVALYSDKGLANSVGTVTFYGNYNADRYNISGASFSTFYVPSGTTLAAGTQLYSDALCKNALAKIGSKGTDTTTTVAAYKYKVSKWGVLWGLKEGQTFYTKKKVTTSVDNLQIYKNADCTTKTGFKCGTDGQLTASSVKIVTYNDGWYIVSPTANGNSYLGTNKFSLQGTIGNTTSTTYYTIGSSSTHCTISGKTTVSTPTVRVNNGVYETYTYNGME